MSATRIVGARLARVRLEAHRLLSSPADQHSRDDETLTEPVRYPGNGTHAVATGMMQLRGKPRPSHRSGQPAVALISREPNAYLHGQTERIRVRGSKIAIRRLAPPGAVLTLKKSAFHLMTDPVIPVLCSLMAQKLVNNYSQLDDISPTSSKLDPGSRATGTALARFSWTPDQVRGDSGGAETASPVGTESVPKLNRTAMDLFRASTSLRRLARARLYRDAARRGCPEQVRA